MKQIFTLSAFLLFALVGFAFRNPSIVTITSMSPAPVRVVINGQPVNEQGPMIRLADLQPGSHRIQIYMQDRFNNGWGNNQQGRLLFNQLVQVRPGMHLDLLINRFGRVFRDEQPYDARFDQQWGNGWGNNGNGWGNNGNGWGNNNGNGWGNNGWGQPMNDTQFEQLRQTVRRESFDDNKLTLLQSVLPNNAVTSQQVKELVQLFSFEKNKLELARFAFRYTVDRGNYFIINEVLSFNSSKQELNRYVANFRD
ncbi:MAG TPA: DUF4476 domain-containing protein [Lacibacter sp.]|nr:DUF4476 domain-containing protein [Lacibacter sp.]HMO87692.1 DUF4476 domain-containing protein [Lacibacter sp.]HMP87372.1 DUF4476 domain-containing protein [Lacibacter sp.]